MCLDSVYKNTIPLFISWKKKYSYNLKSVFKSFFQTPLNRNTSLFKTFVLSRIQSECAEHFCKHGREKMA